MRLPLAVLLLLPFALLSTAVAADDPLITPADAKALERVVQGLARKGHPHEVEILGDVLRNLRAPEKQLKSLAKAKAKAEKAARKPKAATAEAKKLRAIAARLAQGLESREPEAQAVLAQTILRLDADERTAHVALGDVERDGRWLPAWLPALLERRKEIGGYLTRAMHLAVEVETGTENEPLLTAIYGRDATYAKGGGLHLTSCTWSAQSLKRVVVQIARALQFSRWILGKGDVPPSGRLLQVRIVDKRPMYLKALEVVKAQGVMEAWVRDLAGELNSFFDKQNRFVLQTHLETGAMADIFHWRGREQLNAIFQIMPKEALAVGHTNWVSLSVFGVPANDMVYFDEATRAGQAGGRSMGKDPIPERRERMVRLAKAGVRGLRGWLAYLTRLGGAPSWNEGFLADNARIQGDARVKCIFVNEFLQETGQLSAVMEGSKGADGKSPEAIQAAIEKTLAEDLDAFERRFRDWLLYEPGAPGVVQRLGGAGAATAPEDLQTPAALRVLDAIRTDALRGSKPVPKLLADDDLKRGCVLHARFLTVHKDLWDQWPDVHEETVDREGFTPEGNRGGLNSVIAFGCKGPEDAIDQWMGTFFHRLPLIQPGLLGIGWGLADGVAVLDCASLVEVEAPWHTAKWPAVDAKGVPLRFQPELPNPVPGEDQATWGYPITLQYPQTDNLLVFEMTLYKGAAATGTPVPCHFISPQDPKNPDLAPPNAWCLIPKAHLGANTSYFVDVKDKTPGSKTPRWGWTFKTGSG